MTRSAPRLPLLLFTLLIMAGLVLDVPAHGQTATGTISGIAGDESGGAMAGVDLSLVNVDTSVSRRTAADAQGRFTFPFVAPGRYALRAQRDGFAPTQVPDIDVNAGEVLDLRITLKVGRVTDTVTVEAAAPTQLNPSVSVLVEESQLQELPLNNRDLLNLMAMAPGIVTSRQAFNPAVSGTRNSSNNFTVDGLSANEEEGGVLGLGPGANPGLSGLAVPNVISAEAVEEVTIVTSNADASFGRGAGAQVNIVTKSGTNTLRGSVYEFFRHNRLDARNFFNTGPYFNDEGRPIPPPLRYNLFGGTVGGPLARDRHFFFGSYEGFRQREDLVGNVTLPNAALMGLIPGDLGRLFRLSYLDTGFIPPDGNPAGEFRSFSAADRAAAAAAGFPAALFDGSADNDEAGVVIASLAQPRSYTQNAWLLRTDHRFTDRVQVSARYARTRNVFDRYLGRPGTLINTTREYESGLGQMMLVISPSQVVEIRGGWMWTDAPVCRLDLLPELTALGLNQRGLTINLVGTTAFTPPGAGQPCGFEQTETVPQATVAHTWTRGALSLRSGLDVRHISVDFGNFGLGTPTYQFNGLVGATGLLGSGPAQPQAIASAYTATMFGLAGFPPTPQRVYRSLQQEYFAQADWRISPRLTANVGARYSIFGAYRFDGASNLYAVDPSGSVVPDVSPLTFGRTATSVERVTDGRPLYQSDLNNVQPRLGVAWDAAGDGATVIKGAYGIYHDRLFQYAFANVVTNVPGAVSGSAALVPFRLEPPTLAGINPTTPAVFGVDPAIRNPYFHRTTLGVDQRLGRGTSVFAGYVGTFGRDLARIVDLNFGPGFPQALRPDPRFAEVRILTNLSTSRYDALQLHLRAAPAPGVRATLAYTYSRSTDFTFPDTIGATTPVPALLGNQGATANAGFQVGPFTDLPTDAYAGRSDVDVPHVIAATHLVELPFGRGRRWGSSVASGVDAILGGWSLAGLLQARSGVTVNLQLGSDVNDDGNITDRPALLAGSLDDLYAQSGSKTQYFVPQAEALTRLGTPGNVTDPFAQVPYNALRAPFVWSYDVSLQKQAALGGRLRLAVELNAFNVFNRTNLAAPNATISSALFGTITSTVAGMGPRQVQLGARLTF